MVALQICAGAGWELVVADIETAFLQGGPLRRDSGKLYARAPKEGWPQDRGPVIVELVKAVYGLCDGPLQFFRSLVEIFRDLGLQQSVLDPCLFFYRDADGGLAGMIGTEVDDLIIGGTETFKTKVLAPLRSRLVFGKWLSAKTDEGVKFCGRRLRQKASGAFEVDQEAYAAGLKIPKMERSRRKQVEEALTPAEIGEYRAGIGALNWLQTQTRPDLSGKSNILQGTFPTPKVQDFLQLLAVLTEARDTCKTKVVIQAVPWSQVRFVVTTDAAWANLPGAKSQGAYLVFVSDPRIFDNKKATFSPLAWASHRLKRSLNSSFAAEMASLVEGSGVLEWTRVLFSEAVDKGFKLRDWKRYVALRQAMSIVDCRGIFDHVNKPCAGVAVDRRTGIDVAIYKEEFEGVTRWVDTKVMLVDCMTKWQVAADFLREALGSGLYQVVEDEVAMKAKATLREAKKKKRKAQ